MDGYSIPEIFEKEATGKTAFIYEDIKYVLKVPVVNFIFRTIALYENFFSIAWSEVRPNMLTLNMEKAAETLRYPRLSVSPPKINWNQYYDEQTVMQIRKIIFTFNYVNPKLLLIASAWAESLANRPILGKKPNEGFIEPGVFPSLPIINLMQMTAAPPGVKGLLLDIAEKHQTFDVASDFRALAFYPEFLGESWKYLRSYVGSDEYHLLSAKLKKQAINLAQQMPYPVTINSQELKNYYTDAEIAGIFGIVSMFQNFLTALILDGEFLRRIIE